MKHLLKFKRQRQQRREKRVRAKINGTKEKPRLAVFRSLKHIYAQLIDDMGAKTLLSVSEKDLKSKTEVKNDYLGQRKEKVAYAVGLALAAKAQGKKITQVVFDRGRFKYHGRIKALAEGARKGGLVF